MYHLENRKRIILSDSLPPTVFIFEKLPSKLKFQSALECVGVDLELRFKKLPSILNTDKSVETNFIVLSCKLTPTEVKNFLAQFSTFRNFFKNVLEYQNDSKFVRRPNLTYPTIWEKNICINEISPYYSFKISFQQKMVQSKRWPLGKLSQNLKMVQ